MSGEPSRAVFLSYASQDAAAAQRLCDAWNAKIRQQIAKYALFVPVISANTQARLERYSRLEWKLAAQRMHAIVDEKPLMEAPTRP